MRKQKNSEPETISSELQKELISKKYFQELKKYNDALKSSLATRKILDEAFHHFLEGTVGAAAFLRTFEKIAILLSKYFSKEKNPRVSISKPPGAYLTTFLKFAFPRKSYDRIFSEVIEDMREEYFIALAENRNWTAKWRRIQIYPVVFITIFAWAGVSIVDKLVKLWKAI